MNYSLKTNDKVNIVEKEGILEFVFPVNSEGVVNLFVDKELNLKLNLKENSFWTLNIEFENNDYLFKLSGIIENYASLKHNILIHENNQNIEFKQDIDIQDNGEYISALLDVSNGNINFVNNISLNGIYSNSYFRSAVVSNGNSKKNYEVYATNNNISSSSKMDNYGVCKDESKLTFKGVGKISKSFKNSNNHQNSKIIVFDENSNASCLPLLLIDEYDVLASHSAAVGKVNEDHLYYLESRGLSEEKAKEFITMGYLVPVLDYFHEETFKKKAEMVLERRVISA